MYKEGVYAVQVVDQLWADTDYKIYSIFESISGENSSVMIEEFTSLAMEKSELISV